MSKKHKTRKEKIIARLRRELAYKRHSQGGILRKEITVSQEAISSSEKITLKKDATENKSDNSVFSYNLRLIRYDFFKTLVLAFLVFSFEFMLYWWLK